MIEETRNSGNVRIEGSDIRLQGSGIEEILPQFYQLSLCCYRCQSKATRLMLKENEGEESIVFPLCDDCALKECIEGLQKNIKRAENESENESKNDDGEFGLGGDAWKNR